MILGFVIDEHGNLITGEQIEQFQANLNQWFADQAAVFAEIAQACQQVAQAFAAFGEALVRAMAETLGTAPTDGWWQLQGEPDLEYVEQAHRRYARWYNARHRGHQVSWRRLNADQRREAEWRFAQ